MAKKKTYTTETNQDIVHLGLINPILCKMAETPFPVTPGELMHWSEFELEDASEAIALLFYMEELEYVKNIGTMRKPSFELAPYGVTMVELLQNSEEVNTDEK